MCIFNVCRIERGDGGEGGEALHGELAAGGGGLNLRRVERACQGSARMRSSVPTRAAPSARDLRFLGRSSHLALIGGGLDEDRRARAGTRLAGRGNARGGDGDRGGGDGGHGA